MLKNVTIRALTATLLLAVILLPAVQQSDARVIQAAAVAGEAQTVTLLFGGDIMIGRQVEQISAQNKSLAHPFNLISPTLKAADYTIANLELALTDEYTPTGGINLKASPAAAPMLREVGFDLLSLANNHATDFGRQAVTDTLRSLKAAGVLSFGVGAARIVPIKGLRVAFLGYNCILMATPDPRINFLPCDLNLPAAIARVKNDITEAKKVADATIVMMHWGNEHTPTPLNYQRALAKAMAEAGVTLVVGAHPHQVQGWEQIGNTLVVYSLGNLVFDQYMSVLTKNAMMLQVKLDKRGVREATALPIKAYLQTELLDLNSKEAQTVIAEAAKITPQEMQWQTLRPGPPVSTLKAAPPPLPPAPSLVYQRPDPLADAALADLNADGKPELVMLRDKKLLLYEQGKVANDWRLAWQSEPNWQVERFTIANTDGRGLNLAFILWQPDYRWGGNGQVKNQIFIYGWARDGWRAVWAGRPLADPARDLSFFTASDGLPRLAVLEGKDIKQQIVSVWSWNGFGYSLDWRAPANGYTRLASDSLSGQVFYK